MIIVRVENPNDEELCMSAQVLVLDLKAHGIKAKLDDKSESTAQIAVLFSSHTLQRGEVEVINLKTMSAERVQADEATEKIAAMMRQQ